MIITILALLALLVVFVMAGEYKKHKELKDSNSKQIIIPKLKCIQISQTTVNPGITLLEDSREPIIIVFTKIMMDHYGHG